jgi:hypothetical protein
MIIAVYDQSNTCFICHKDCEDVQVLENETGSHIVQWSNGGLTGVDYFLVLDDGIVINEGDDISSFISQDRKEEFKTQTIKQRFAKLQEDNLAMQDAINFLLGI